MLIKRWILNLPANCKQEIHSIMLYNSLARCDYIPGISDADVLAIIENEEAFDMVNKNYMQFCDNYNLAYKRQPHEIQAKKDLYFDLWMFTTNDLPDPSAGKEGIQYFRELWTHDFIQNAVLLFGRDIRSRLQPPPIEEAAPEALKNICTAWDNYLTGITDKALMEEILYLKVPTFLTYIRSALIVLVVASGCRDWRKTALLENLSKYAPEFPYRDDAAEAIKLALNPKGMASLGIPGIRKLIQRNRVLLDKIKRYITVYPDASPLGEGDK
jgi:hypothetical protein